MTNRRFIHPSLSPNLEISDVLNCLKLLCSPFAFTSDKSIRKVEDWFKNTFHADYAYSFSSARAAEYAVFSAIEIKKGDEVLIQAFTCAAVVYPILWIHATPIYVDIDKKNLSMDISDLKKKITKKTKALILQHTFGIPGNVEEIKKIAKEKKIMLIEDCAHIIDSSSNTKKLGEYGDCAFFSFGRDKAVSSVSGGILITNDKTLAEKITLFYDQLSYPPLLWIYQQLLHPIVTYKAIIGFNIFPVFGKTILFISKRLGFISLPVDSNEFEKPQIKKYPNTLASLCYSQLLRLERFNMTRLDIYKKYKKELGSFIELPRFDSYYLRIPVQIKNKEKLFSFCKKNLIYLGDWYSHVIDPRNTDFDRISYKKGSCKNAEAIAQNIVNLPSYPTMSDEDMEYTIEVLKQYFTSLSLRGA